MDNESAIQIMTGRQWPNHNYKHHIRSNRNNKTGKNLTAVLSTSTPNRAKTSNTANYDTNVRLPNNLQRQTLGKHYALSERMNNREYNIILLKDTWFTRHTEGVYSYSKLNETAVNLDELRFI